MQVPACTVYKSALLPFGDTYQAWGSATLVPEFFQDNDCEGHMRWITHQVGALGTALWLQLPLAGVAAAWVGGILPDVMDQKMAGLSRNRQRAFNRIHRGFTHWPGLWLGLVILAVVFVPHESVRLLRPVCVGLAVGGLSHVILDMLTPQGVPFLPFSRKNRFSLKLCKTGGIGEYLFLAAMLAGMAFFLRDDIVRQAQGLLPALFGRV